MLVLVLFGTCMAGVSTTYSQNNSSKGLLSLSSPAVGRDTRFAPMATGCTVFQPPRLMAGRASTSKGTAPRTLVIDLIVLDNGRVEDPMIVEGSDASIDDEILQMVGGWRYRPATCDGTPIPAEGRVHVRLEGSLASSERTTPKVD